MLKLGNQRRRAKRCSKEERRNIKEDEEDEEKLGEKWQETKGKGDAGVL